MINVTRTYLPPFEEFCEEIRGLWESRIVTNIGPRHEEFREALQAFLEAPQVSLFSSGHLALESILRCMNFPAGGEVITTPFTFVSTVNAVIRCGLEPVFADVNPSDGTLDPESVRALIGPRTVAILPVHVYGNVCDAESFADMAASHGLRLIYDAAHAFGVKYEGRSALTLGDASIVSFHATKVFSTVEGGAVVLPRRDDALFQLLDDEKNFGIRGYESCVSAGGNAKMNELQAAMGICNLRHFDEVLAMRKAVYERYMELLPGGVRVLAPMEGAGCNYSYMPVLLDNRDRVYDKLLEEGVRARKYFYPLASEFDFCRKYNGTSSTPVAKDLSSHVLCLPLYPGLTENEQDKIIFCISENI